MNDEEYFARWKGCGGGGQTFQGVRLTSKLIFQAKKKNTSFVKSSLF